MNSALFFDTCRQSPVIDRSDSSPLIVKCHSNRGHAAEVIELMEHPLLLNPNARGFDEECPNPVVRSRQ
ncbi:MAG: hypothetical protein JWM11_6242 [Planctomycetaceae bacterium]|nr:hypothetical protein [Planctomycetaceae bacterium]